MSKKENHQCSIHRMTTMNRFENLAACHSERSEESQDPNNQKMRSFAFRTMETRNYFDIYIKLRVYIL